MQATKLQQVPAIREYSFLELYRRLIEIFFLWGVVSEKILMNKRHYELKFINLDPANQAIEAEKSKEVIAK